MVLLGFIRFIRQFEARLADVLQRTFGRRALLTVGALLLAVSLGASTSRIHVKPIFYATVAQVLPVLLLVAVVEGRYFRHLDRRESFDRFFLKGLLLTPIIGETAALVCVALGHDNLALRGFTLLAFVATGTLLFAYATVGPLNDPALRSTTTQQMAKEVKRASQFGRSASSQRHRSPPSPIESRKPGQKRAKTSNPYAPWIEFDCETIDTP